MFESGLVIIFIMALGVWFYWKSKCKYCGSENDVIKRVCDKCWCAGKDS